MFRTGYTQLLIESEQDLSEELISWLGCIAFGAALFEYVCACVAYAFIVKKIASVDVLHWMVPAYILAAMVVEYIIFKVMFGQKVVFASLRWWSWYFLSLAPNYAQILSTMLVAAVCSRFADALEQCYAGADSSISYGLGIAILIFCIISALLHFALIAYWARAARGADNVSDAYDALGEVFDATNLQFVAMAIRTDKGLSIQRSRLLTSMLLKAPVLFPKCMAMFIIADASSECRTTPEVKRMDGQAFAILQGVLLTGYGIAQLLPSFCRMAQARCLYCMALVVLVLVSLFDGFIFVLNGWASVDVRQEVLQEFSELFPFFQ